MSCSPQVIDCEQIQTPQLLLTTEGELVAEQGSHEANVFRAIGPDGMLQAELMSSVANAKVGFSKAIAAKWIRVDKSEGAPRIFRNVRTPRISCNWLPALREHTVCSLRFFYRF